MPSTRGIRWWSALPRCPANPLVGEYAIPPALAHGRSVLHTPLEGPLQPETLRDFAKQFGADQVGPDDRRAFLSTNRGGSIVVRPTEILPQHAFTASRGIAATDPLAVWRRLGAR